jgi:hypothetical protein
MKNEMRNEKGKKGGISNVECRIMNVEVKTELRIKKQESE